MSQRVSAKFWDYTWSGRDVADGLQQQYVHGEAMDAILGDQAGTEEFLRADESRAAIYATIQSAQRAWEHMADPSCRVVMVGPDQFRSLPGTSGPASRGLDINDLVGSGTSRSQSAWEIAQESRPPFPTVYFDLAGASGLGVKLLLHNPGPEHGGLGTDWGSWLTGVIMHEHDDALEVLPVLRERRTLPNGMHILIPGRTIYLKRGAPLATQQSLGDILILETGQESLAVMAAENEQLRSGLTVARTIADICLPLLMLMESINVTLVEGALTPKQGKVAAKKRRLVPLIVSIRRNSKRYAKRPVNQTGRQRTIQSETCGHFKHHGEGTPVYRAGLRDHPEKLREYPRTHYRYGTGKCFRFWCPPYVSGPADAPLVLKARRVTGDDARRGHEEDAA